MARRSKEPTEPIFTVKLQKGLADRHRLPLSHVLSVLEEVRRMIGEVGRELQKEAGIDDPSGDFGLELVAGTGGIIFRRGSIQANVAITQQWQYGILATERVLDTVHQLGKTSRKPAGSVAVAGDRIEKTIVGHLDRIASIQKNDRTELRLSMRKPIQDTQALKPRMSATLGPVAVEALRALHAPTFATENITLYGKLYQLIDKTNADEGTGKFWGELRRETGEVWRVQFRADQEGRVSGLFRKQVRVTGRAVYYSVFSPKLVAEDIDKDEDRNYERAFDELFGCDKDILHGDLETLLHEMHGG